MQVFQGTDASGQPQSRVRAAWVPLEIFEKAEDGRIRKKIRGIASTEHFDLQDDRLLQGGIDFDPLMMGGWFNDNHSKKTADVLGYPDRIAPVEVVDDHGRKVKATLVEGYLLDTPEAKRIADLAESLKGTPRQLGFSLEGDILKRDTRDNRIVVKARVRNIAITNCPVNPYTSLSLVKSMQTAERLFKAASVGHAFAAPGVAVAGSIRPLTPRLLIEPAPASQVFDEFEKLARSWRAKGQLRKSRAAIDEVRRRFPHASAADADRILRLAAAVGG